MFKVLTEGCKPTKATKYSAAVDVYASHDVTIGAGETKLVGLGIAINLDNLLENVPMVKDMRRWHKERFKAGIIDVSEEDSLIPIKDEFLKSNYIQLMLNDSLATKGLILNSGIKIFNLDFADELKMIIHNPLFWSDHIVHSNEIGVSVIQQKVCKDCNFIIKKGDKIGQLILLEHKSYLMDIKSNNERNGGFSSTD